MSCFIVRAVGADIYWLTQLNRVKTFPPQYILAGRVNSEYHQTPCYKLNKPQVLGTCLV